MGLMLKRPNGWRFSLHLGASIRWVSFKAVQGDIKKLEQLLETENSEFDLNNHCQAIEEFASIYASMKSGYKRVRKHPYLASSLNHIFSTFDSITPL